MIKISKIHSPFEEYDSVDPKNFVGRTDIINNFISKVSRDSNKKLNCFLITGNKEMGKSSLLDYLKTYAEEELGFLSSYVFLNNKDINDITSISEQTISNLLCNTTFGISDEEELIELLKKFSIDFIKISDVSNISWREIRFTEEFLKKVNINFGEFFLKLIKQISPNGIFFEIDTSTYWEDIDEISIFSKWIPEFIYYLENNDFDIPIIIALALPKNNCIDLLRKDNYLKEIFTVEDLRKLSNEEVKTYLENGFDRFEWRISEDVMNMLVELSLGHPAMMRHFGQDIYWNLGVRNKDFGFLYNEGLSMHVAVANQQVTSIEEVYNVLETLYRNDYYLDMIRKNDKSGPKSLYFSILNKILEDFKQNFDGYYFFKKQTIIKKLNLREKEIFENFIKRLEDLEVIKFNSCESAYEFKDPKILIDFQIWSHRYKEKQKMIRYENDFYNIK